MADFPGALSHSQVFFLTSVLCWMVFCAFWKVFPHLLLSHGSSSRVCFLMFSEVGLLVKRFLAVTTFKYFLFEFYEVKMGLLVEIILKFPRNLWVFFTLISWCWKRVDVSRALTSEWFSLVHFLLDFESWLVTSVLPLPVPHNPRSSLLFEVSVVGWWLSHWRWLLCVHDLPQVVPKAESSVARKGPRYDSGVSHLGYGCWIASQAEYPLNYYQEATSDMY